MGQLTNLYHAHDADGRLLYVGISLNALTRLQQHMRRSQWTDHVETLKIERFPDRATALAAEKLAIVAKQPIYNVIHNRPRQPNGLAIRADHAAVLAAIDALDRAQVNAPHRGTLRPKYVFRHEIESVLGCSFAGLVDLAAQDRFPAPLRHGRVLCWQRDVLIFHLKMLLESVA